jgi:hypothetical protein
MTCNGIANVCNYGAKPDLATVADTCTLVGGVLTTAAPHFAASDVGKRVRINGYTYGWYAISGYTSPTQVALAGTSSDGGGDSFSWGSDNTAAFQLAVDDVAANGGMVYVPWGAYAFLGTVVLKSGVRLSGASSFLCGQTGPSSNLVSISKQTLLATGSTNRHVTVERLRLTGQGNTLGIGSQAAIALYASHPAWIRECDIEGFDYGIQLVDSARIHVRDCYVNAHNRAALYAQGSYDLEFSGNLMANSGQAVASGTALDGNYVIYNSNNIRINDLMLDEACYASLNLAWASEVEVNIRAVYSARPQGGIAYGIVLGDGTHTCSRINIRGAAVSRYGGSGDGPTNTIKIFPGCTNVVLEDVTTAPAPGGGDIDDQGTDTVWRNVNGQDRIP